MIPQLTAFILSLLLGVVLSRASRRTLAWLTSRERKVGKEKIHRLFPKPRRPLGGGLAIMLSATVGVLAAAALWRRGPSAEALWVLPLAWSYAAIGLADDLGKVGGRGLGDRRKLALQMVPALVFGLALWLGGGMHLVRVPFVPFPVDFGILYVPFAALVILAAANAVNLSDGIDGLAGGAVAITLLGLAAAGVIERYDGIPFLCWPFIGATLGFLVYNLPPARLLMGDTGALGLGAAIAGAAIFARAEFWLVLLGAPFVVNAASVLIQMGTVRGLWRLIQPLRHRTTETSRPFLCTPLHHHFQWLGWTDWRVLALFWGLGAGMALWALVALRSGVGWLIGVIALGAFLVGAALQKLLQANYFLGLLPRPGEVSRVALYRGLPVSLGGLPLHRVQYETSITERMLGGATAESILWRPISEVEAHVVLGKIHADHKLFDQALSEWEQVPTRNLVIRPNVVLRLARIYYGRDRLLEAIKLWEELPPSRLQEMPNVREVVRSAKLRLADLASKAHRQSMRRARAAEGREGSPGNLEAHLVEARRLNQDLLSLLLYEREKLRGRQADPRATRVRRELLRRTQNAVLGRVEELDAALGTVARAAPAASPEERAVGGDPAERAAQELHLSPADLARLLGSAGEGRHEITSAAVHPKASRNTVFRLGLHWEKRGPSSVIAKRYSADRIAFYSACYRRERGVLELLRRYGCAVPRIYGGELGDDQAVLLMEDLGDETLAERLEAFDSAVKEQWLHSAVLALVALHATTQAHLRELTDEIRKIDKETLGPEYYLSALRIALERIAGVGRAGLSQAEWERIAEQARPLVDFLSDRPAGFIHFEFTPHHLLVTDAGLHVFDFEQATIGPAEFDLAALLAQPESHVGPQSWDRLVEHYVAGREAAGVAPAGTEQMERAVGYAALFKCLVYAGAAGNFLDKFGGEHHLQRFHYYLDRCQGIMARRPPLRPLGRLLGPWFRGARAAATPGAAASAGSR